MSNYDRHLEPRERSGWYEVKCGATVLTCGRCNGVCRKTRPGPSDQAIGECQSCGYKTAIELHERHGWSGDDMGEDECGETWQSHGHWTEGYGVELRKAECPRCGHDGDKIECEEES